MYHTFDWWLDAEGTVRHPSQSYCLTRGPLSYKTNVALVVSPVVAHSSGNTKSDNVAGTGGCFDALQFRSVRLMLSDEIICDRAASGKRCSACAMMTAGFSLVSTANFFIRTTSLATSTPALSAGCMCSIVTCGPRDLYVQTTRLTSRVVHIWF